MANTRTTLGHSSLCVRPIGLGCMGMSQFYGDADRSEAIATIRLAIDLGVDFFDTSDVYGAVGARRRRTDSGTTRRCWARRYGIAVRRSWSPPSSAPA
ncbi:aldo/keto reductase [Streptomyces minutiscleroticus]|uniref:aldo/keto reductase n=1 Tax=Streptomyces minutiscleroticus TaxID=68238 RepID=UPI003D9DE84A